MPLWLHTPWYATAEILALLTALMLLGEMLLPFFKKLSPTKLRTIGVLSGILFILLIALDFVLLTPQRFQSKAEHTSEELVAAQWINENIPVNARIGSWSSGVLGYFTKDRPVVNLDGLANSPEFVKTVFIGGVPYGRSLSPQNTLWDYMQKTNIHYLADSEFESKLENAPFFACVPLGHYKVLYRGNERIDWHEKNGIRRFTIVELTY